MRSAIARTRRVAGGDRQWRQGARRGAPSVRHARPSSFILPASLEGEDHRARQRSARQHQRIKLGGEFGIFQGWQQMAGLLVLITDIHALGLQGGAGTVLTTSFYWDMDDKTREWSKRFFAKVNHMPTMWQAGVYSSVMSYLTAVKAAGTDEPLKVAAKMRKTPIRTSSPATGGYARTA